MPIHFRTILGMRTEKGPFRQKNEDCIGFLQTPETRNGADALYLVADGLGGHEHGDVASAMAVDLMLETFGAPKDQKDHIDVSFWEHFLAQTLRDISETIYLAGANGEAMHRDPRRAGMATTLTAGLLAGDTLYLGHVGDSRAYIFRGDELTQLTQDHTILAEQASQGISTYEGGEKYMNNMLTQAIGSDHPIMPFTSSLTLKERDCLLLSSDGLHGFLDDNAIAGIIRDEKIEDVVDSLISEALAAGSNDNVTVLLVFFEAKESSALCTPD